MKTLPGCLTRLDAEPMPERARFVEVIFHGVGKMADSKGFIMRFLRADGDVYTTFGRRIWVERPMLHFVLQFPDIVATQLGEADTVEI